MYRWPWRWRFPTPALILFAFVQTLCACGAPSLASGPWIATQDTSGDTILIETISGSIWGKIVSLREDLRLGRLEGPDEELFGEVTEVAVGPEGDIFVFDTQLPALRQFDANGDFVRTIGREGEGPGEYSKRPDGLLVDRTGRIVLRDPDLTRLTAYTSEGQFLGVLGGARGLHSLRSRMVATDTAGTIYIKILMIDPGPGMPTPWPIGLEVRDAEGLVIDTIPPPLMADGEQASRFEIHPFGALVVGSSDVYGFEIRSPDGTLVKVRMPFQPVRYTEAELARLRAAMRPIVAADGGQEPDLPAVKPAFLEFFFGPQGRIWVRRPISPSSGTQANPDPRYEPSVFDAFDPDGSYLGEIDFPENGWPVAFSDTHVYVIEKGEYDEQYVVRYRLQIPDTVRKRN